MGRERGRIRTRFDKVQQAEATEKIVNLQGSLYALLFDGYVEQKSIESALAYQSLIKSGVDKSQILFLKGDGTRSPDHRSATLDNLELAVDSLKHIAKPDDRLLFYFASHGNVIDREYYFESYDGIVWEKDLAQMMRGLSVNFSLFYFSQCYGGQFAERIGFGRNIGLSAVSRREKSWAHRGIGRYFTNNLFSKLLKDNVSIEQAFDWAAKEAINFFSWSK